MELRTHIYDCKKPSQNQIPAWMRLQKEKTEEKEPDLVEQFKKNPDSFFSGVLQKALTFVPVCERENNY